MHFINQGVLLLLTWSCSKIDSQDTTAETLGKAECFLCPALYEPVCASNGITYDNPCLLKCGQLQEPYIVGLCKGKCPCCKEPYMEPAPVNPGWGWSSYDPEDCICAAQFEEPICGSDGKTYRNSCVLQCAQRQDPYLSGLCKGECPCCNEPYVEDPVNSGQGWPASTMGRYKENKTDIAS